MRIQLLLVVLAASVMILPQPAAADPPSHAPAHGQRKKHHTPAPVISVKTGITVSFDSLLGVHMAVGIPGVYFHEGHYFRQHDGHWQISLSGDGGWKASTITKVPGVILHARKKMPKPRKSRKHRGNHK